MAEKIRLKKLLDKKWRDTLSNQQLALLAEQLKTQIAGLGRPVEDDLADFAVRISGGKWKAADHLRLLSTEIGRLERREQLNGREQRFLTVSMPPRHGKSLLLDVWLPIWWLTRHPTNRVILAGYGEQFARLWGGQVRDLIIEHAETLNLVISKDRNAADDWQLNRGGGMICTGVGGSLVGRGADLLIIDDPIKNEQEAYSEVYRERMWDWFQAAAFTRLEPHGVCIVIATRWHEDDLIGRIHKNDEAKLWQNISIAALAEEGDPLGRPLGAPLWPERFTDDPDYSIRQSSMSPYWWSAQYQQHPTPEGGGVILRDWFRFYNQPVDSILESADQVIQSWDPALSDKPTADYWVGQVWARKGGNLFLIDQARGHYSLAQATGIMKNWLLKYPTCHAKLIENSAMGPAIKQTLHHEIPGIIPIPARGTKLSRIEAITPFLMAGNVYLPENENGTKPKWVWEFVEECAAFPAGVNDDILDAMSQALSFLSPAGWKQLRQESLDYSLPEKSPIEERRAWFNSVVDKTMKTVDRKFNGTPYGSRRLW